MNSVKYSINTYEDIVECAPFSYGASPFIIRDEEDDKKGKEEEMKILEYYFITSYTVFLDRLRRFKELAIQASDEEQRELSQMLQTLINTQRLLIEEKIEYNNNKKG